MRADLATLITDYRRFGKETAVVVYRGNREHVCSYGALADLAERFAAELMRREIRSGERVVIWGQNGPEWIAAFFGCVLRGVLAVPLDAAGGGDFAQRVMAETGPRLLTGDASMLGRLTDGTERLAFEEFAEGLPRPPFPQALREPSLGTRTPLQILFTSGTTSEPKGIVHTHGNVLASLEPIEREMQKYLRYERIFHPLRFLHTLPLSHVFGQFMGLWVPPLMGAEVHFENRLQAPRLMELIRGKRISVLAAVPRVLDLLKSHVEGRFPRLGERLERARSKRIWWRWWELRDVHHAFGFKFWAFVCGGASLPPALEGFWNDLGFALIQGYGMTETAALITLNHLFHIARGTIGKPLPGREVRFGPDGEVLVRGPMVASSRWQHGHVREMDDPWLATGDLVQQDEAGQLHFMGRKSEIIVTAAGLNIHPEDVEAALNRQAGVESSALVPLETSAGAEAVAVLLFKGGESEAQAAVDAANATLAEYQRVRRWRLWPQLDFPRSGIGKVQRQKVAQWVAAQTVEGASPAAQADPLAAKLTAITGSTPVRMDDDARLDRDLNLDSLARVQLQSELEQQLGISIGDEEFERISTVGQLRALLGLKSPAASGTGAAGERQPATQGEAVLERKYQYPQWPWWWVVKAARVVFVEAIMRPLVWLLAAPRVVQRAGSLPERPMLLIANHVTAFDGALVLYALPGPVRRNVAVAMSGEMLEDMRHARKQGNWLLNLAGPLEYWLLTALFNVFPLPRGAGFRRSFAHAGAAMDHGYHVMVFPEGHRTDDGLLQKFRSGIGLLALESKADILPVAVAGLGELKQRGKGWVRSGRIAISVGEALTPDSRLAPEELAKEFHDRVAALLQRAESASG
jgi:long-chain acyl-CoA synthetase